MHTQTQNMANGVVCVVLFSLYFIFTFAHNIIIQNVM